MITPLLALALAVVPVTPPEPAEPPYTPPLYVHCLSCPAVNVEGLSWQYLVEAVTVAQCESRHREGAIGRNGQYEVLGYLQLTWDGAMQRVAREMGYEREDLLEAEPNLRTAARWRELTDRGVPWRLWACKPNREVEP